MDTWDYFQSNATLSRSTSCSSLPTLDIDINTTSPQYATLWEIQLELGEIPDMISNNLLEPCPTSSSSLRFDAYYLSAHNPCKGQVVGKDQETVMIKDVDVKKDVEGKGKEEEAFVHRQREVSVVDSEPPTRNRRLVWPTFLFLFKNGSRPGIVPCPNNEGEDEGEVKEEGKSEQREALVNHPVYGMLSSREVQGGEFRHDRKDSGVFVHNDLSLGLERHGSTLLPAVADYATKDREQHGRGAAYISLQRIAATFSRSP
ncbi:hypothetical protein BGZ99_009208 [Dissophora globulifera]|uniref:Uncharacterized protein n=1 Tax=Dissophora globulifera TaxID=979702 RepID=A0A9P6R7H2_9FUNG|nr:hypothetical protein BGZ99_009208 [Dissophora globulifera]